ncbi:hypothetical protein G6F57_014120 [Rhizopus arrhizus]|nr:hypothetical protein G6F57_014120 [Rhizopus arrhizus]
MSDGTPKGYALLDVAGNGSYRLQYRVAGKPASEQIGLHAPKVLRQGAYPAWGIYANVYMGEDASVVEYRVDGGAWQPMKQVSQPDPRLMVENVADDLAVTLRGYDRSPEATASPHLWRGALPTDLAVGSHKVEPADCPALTRGSAAPAKGTRMDIRFMAGTTPVTLSRHWFTGAMLLQSATEKVWVQHPWHPGTHFSFSLVQSWLRHIAGHEVLVERTRPLLFAGFRPQRLRVLQARVTIAAASPVSTDSARGGLPRRLVVADVGGTFARLALAETLAGQPPRLGSHRTYACAEYPSLAAILADFTSGLGQPVKTAVVAIAGLLDGDVLINSNLPWTVSLSATRAQSGLHELQLINDFEAVALAIPYLQADTLVPLNGDADPAQAFPALVLGAGTGLGAALRFADGERPVLASEIGHAALGAGNALELQVLGKLLQRWPHVDNERVLSGTPRR